MIIINGKRHAFAGGQTIEDLLKVLSNTKEFAFISSNNSPCGVIFHGYIVPSAKYGSTIINEGDKIDILPYLAGG